MITIDSIEAPQDAKPARYTAFGDHHVENAEGFQE
jgi:hypothetical protein